MKRLLIVVDYQNDFVEGTLANRKAQELEDYLVGTIREYEERKDDILFTLDTHQEDYLSTEEGKNLPVVHCLEGTWGHRLAGRIEKLSKGHRLFKKETFPSLDLALYLRGRDYAEVTLVGVVTDICVLSNAIMVKSALPNAHVVIDARGCASNDAKKEQECYDVCSSLQIEVRNR